MIDRGFVKWQPFNSLTPLKNTIKEIESETKSPKPELLEDPINGINNAILEAYYSKDEINITYYEKGKLKYINTTIKKINPSLKTIELGNNKILFFKQILDIH